MSSKYVFDMTSGLVKILQRGKKYYVYRLKELQEFPASGHSLAFGEHKYKFKWESKASQTHNYKPYDDGDVYSSPGVYVGDIRKWHPYKIRLMI